MERTNLLPNDNGGLCGGKHSLAGRYLLLATLTICVMIAAMGVGLGAYVYSISDRFSSNCPVILPTNERTSTPSSTPTPTSSNMFVSSSVEGSYRYGAVASDAGICSKVGTDIMAIQGGSAVDAAVAALLCQCVQNLHSCGIGGGHFMTVYNRENRTAYTIIGREMAPAAAAEDMYVGNQSSTEGDIMTGATCGAGDTHSSGTPDLTFGFCEGGMAIGIPGEIKGLHKAWTIGGKLPWKTLFQPTIRLLRDGMPVNKALATAIAGSGRFYPRHDNLRKLLTNPSTGFYYKEGEIMTWPALAKTFTVIAEQGPDAFYNGSLSQDIVDDIQEGGDIMTGATCGAGDAHSSGTPDLAFGFCEGGAITLQDLQNYTAVVKDPLIIKLNDNSTVYSPPPPSSGAVYEMILNIVDGSVNFPRKSGVRSVGKPLREVSGRYRRITNVTQRSVGNPSVTSRIRSQRRAH